MAELLEEKWMKGVAITTTCLAVMTAIAAARGSAGVSKTQLLVSNEGSQWAYYQAKSIKLILAESERKSFEGTLLGSLTDAQKSYYEQHLADLTKDIKRYSDEKEKIKQEAEATGHANKLLAKKNIFFSASVVFLQIAIMLSSVSALLKQRFMWMAGLAVGFVGLVLLAYALFLPPLFF